MVCQTPTHPYPNSPTLPQSVSHYESARPQSAPYVTDTPGSSIKPLLSKVMQGRPATWPLSSITNAASSQSGCMTQHLRFVCASCNITNLRQLTQIGSKQN